MPTYKARVVARWNTASVNLLLNAEKAWWERAGMPREKLAKAGTIFMRFQRWGVAFKGRLMTDRVAAKVSSLRSKSERMLPSPLLTASGCLSEQLRRCGCEGPSCWLHWGWPWQLLLLRTERRRHFSAGVLRRRWNPYLART